MKKASIIKNVDMKETAFILITLLAIISCERESLDNSIENCFEINKSDTIKHTLESNWIFLGYIDKETDSKVCKPETLGEMTISIDNFNYFNGTSSCNYFEGYYVSSENNSLLFNSLVSTEKFCLNDTVMQWEDLYYSNLDKVNSYSIINDILTLSTDTKNDLVFRFESKTNKCLDFDNTDKPDATLFRIWTYLGYIDTEEHCKPENIPEMNIEFRNTNIFEAFGSCNHFEGDFEVMGNDSIKTNNVKTTSVYCINDIIRDWEEHYYNGLQNVTKYEIEGAKLTLITNTNDYLIFKAD